MAAEHVVRMGQRIRERREEIGLLATICCVFLAGCSGGEASKPSSSSVEDTVRPQLREQLHKRGAGLSSLSCVVPSDTDARCIAKVTYKGTRQTVGVDVTIDPESGKVLWETTD